jgi:hypothetical protein
MLFSAALDRANWLADPSQRLRTNYIAAYAIALVAVGLARLLRRMVGPHLMAGSPFSTYYPAIIITTLLAGFWPGVVATILSALVAWSMFISYTTSFSFISRELHSSFYFSSCQGRFYCSPPS